VRGADAVVSVFSSWCGRSPKALLDGTEGNQQLLDRGAVEFTVPEALIAASAAAQTTREVRGAVAVQPLQNEPPATIIIGFALRAFVVQDTRAGSDGRRSSIHRMVAAGQWG
jgi:hypothetical protein